MSNSNSYESDFDSDKESENNEDLYKFPVAKKTENQEKNEFQLNEEENDNKSEKISDSENGKLFF